MGQRLALYLNVKIILLLPIGGTNNFVRVEAQSDRIICTFLNAQDGDKSCSIVYGRDCQQLDSETLTGRAQEGDSVIVPLLQNTEVYCYLVTAISGDTSVNIMGNFKTGKVILYYWHLFIQSWMS